MPDEEIKAPERKDGIKPKRNFEIPYLKNMPTASVYSVFDTDLARDNLENDLTPADIQDLKSNTY